MQSIILAFLVSCATLLFGGIIGTSQGFKAGEIEKAMGDNTYIINNGNIYHQEENSQDFLINEELDNN